MSRRRGRVDARDEALTQQRVEQKRLEGAAPIVMSLPREERASTARKGSDSECWAWRGEHVLAVAAQFPCSMQRMYDW